MPATIKDIAKKLSISVSTVSYALNGGPRPVPEEVRKRVFEAARELDYRPNRVARSLITRRSHTIGIVPPDRTSHYIVLGPFMQFALTGIMNEAEDLGHDVLIFTRCNGKDPNEVVNQLLDGRVDGMIFFPGYDDGNVLSELDRAGFPYVHLASRSSVGGLTIGVDNAKAVNIALQHLLDLGHRRIGHIQGRPSHTDSQERFQLYRRFLDNAGLPYCESWVASGNFTLEGGMEAARAILLARERPTAIFAANDEMAVGAVHAAEEMGLRVPADVSVIGMDDIPHARACKPALTTIRQPIMDIGVAATRLLISLIEDNPIEIPTSFEPELVVRATTARPTED